MLSSFDDFPIHQTSQPIAHTASTDINHYDRYFFNGVTKDARLFFALAMGLYPNRHVVDSSFSVVVDGGTVDARQISVHASGRAPADRADANEVGPIRVEVLEPLNALRIVVEAAEHGLRADLTFVRRSAPIEEPHFRQQVGMRVVFDYTRLTQFGTWEGWIEVDGVLTDLAPGETLGSRDRSWGVRPVGERGATGAPVADPQFFWLWAPINFDTFSTHFDVNEYFDGRRWHDSGFVAPITGPEGAHTAEAMRTVDYTITWRPGTRTAATFELVMTPWQGESSTITLEPLYEFQMSGLGYLHPEWSHGVWKGESAVGGERWDLPVDDPVAPEHVHVQAIVRARTTGAIGEHEGIGVLEQLAIGRHDPTGLTGIFDGFAG
ncbi:MAG TPA: hypothetical protein VK853_10100 [Ilumatobacteraceae bacterium]|nr:hypothetical protein [Ilumatobacteraceae bacterium]